MDATSTLDEILEEAYGPARVEYEWGKVEKHGHGTSMSDRKPYDPEYNAKIFGARFKPESYAECKHIKGDMYNVPLNEHLLGDGTYDVTDLPFLHLEDNETFGEQIGEDGLAFIQQHGIENIYIGSGYQVLGIFLFAGKPKELDWKDVGLGSFGRGACARMENLPKAILIIAEDD